MSNGLPPLFQGMAVAMRNLAQRQNVIAQNIANSETPGYRARTVEAPDFGNLLDVAGAGGPPRVGRPQVTISSGMAALGASQTVGGNVVLDRDVSETKPDGNNVTLEDQVLNMGRVQQDFAALTGLYRKQMSLLRTAIGRGA